MPPSFRLDHALAAWRRTLVFRRALSDEDRRELEAHVRDHIDALVARGLSEEDAFHTAVRAVGDVAQAEAEYGKVYWEKAVRRRTLRHELTHGLAMLKNYVTVALRALQKHPLYAAINVTGLAVGLACCLLIFLLVRHEWSFDRFHTHADSVYRVLVHETTPDGSPDLRHLTPPGLGPAMKAEFPSITSLTRVVGGTLDVRHEDQLLQEEVYEVDSTFFEVFTFPLLAGDPATALDQPQSTILTERTAATHFPDTPPSEVLGRTVTIQRGDNQWDFTVTGVAADVPLTSSLQFDVLLPFAQYTRIPLGANDWGSRASLYVRLAEGETAETFEEKLSAFTARELASRIEGRRQAGLLAEGADALRLTLQPLRALHRMTEASTSYEVDPVDPMYSYMLAGIGLLVLLIACINFTTLAIGRSASRAREVGVRKVLGSHRRQLMAQFWGEAVLMALLALVVGLGLAALALPTFNQLTGRALTLSLADSGGGLLLLMGLITLVGLVAGSYPAAVLSRFEPAQVLKGAAKSSGHPRFTRALVLLQYTLSIALLIGTLGAYSQLDYLLTKDLGFEEEYVVVVHTNRLSSQQERSVLSAFRSGVEPHERIDRVVGTGYAFTHSYDTRSWNDASGAPFTAHMLGVDYDYLDVMGMELAAGRSFSRAYPSDSTRSVLVNEAFVREHGIAEPIGHRLTGFSGFFGDIAPTIIGVVEDFNFRPLHEEVPPAVLNMHPNYYMGMNAMLVKVQPGALDETVALLEGAWTQVFPDKPFVYTFLDEDLAAQYQEVRRWSRIVTYAAGFAILIACLGLFGLATLSVTQRTKEIGIRKVLGASAQRIVLLLTREIAGLVALATVLAWPLAYVGLDRWLSEFAYHIAMPWGLFPLAGLAALGLALLTVGVHAARAATADPVRSLRYE